ncbi:hypothetical protein FRC11_006523, partial [Ceratobasidium sp. 423]
MSSDPSWLHAFTDRGRVPQGNLWKDEQFADSQLKQMEYLAHLHLFTEGAVDEGRCMTGRFAFLEVPAVSQ